MSKTQRLLIAFFIILAASLANIGIIQNRSANAQSQVQNDTRYKTVDQTVTQNVWNLVSQATSSVLCEVTIDRSGEPTQQDALNVCPDLLTSATPAPASSAAFFKNTFWSFVVSRQVTTQVKVAIPDIVVNISAPVGGVQLPYVTLLAYEPVKEYSITSIQGSVGQRQFTCDSNLCNVPVDQTTQVTFHANSSLGDSSLEVTANVDVTQRSDGYYVSLVTVSNINTFQDACAAIWGSNIVSTPSWAVFPRLPDLLNTNKKLFYLANRLIFTGVVNASDCPGNGLFADGSPNACGLDRASTTMTTWQNQFDPFIWSAGQKYGIPPKLIKSLIEKESQFWPANSRLFVDEFGLAQMNQVGADVALRWNSDLFTKTCTGLLADCGTSYASLPSWEQAMVRGKLMSLVNPECPTCINSMDLSTTNASVEIFTQVIKANCSQASFIMKDNVVSAGYDDMWKFTLASFHSGYKCLNDAIIATKKASQPVTWTNVSQRFDCPSAAPYVDDVWTNLVNFDKYVLPIGGANQALHLPTFMPTPSPMPSPTLGLSKNTIRVFVYLVFERKPFPQNTVWADGVPVQVVLPNGSTLTQVVKNGQTLFDMSNYQIGSLVSVNLPTLYRSQTIQLTAQGELLVTFNLIQPELPLVLP